MKSAKLALICALMACAVAAQQPGAGIRPRTTPADYAAHRQAKDFVIGAAQLSATQVQNAFVTELNKRYVVVEVGIYPASGSALTLERADFALRVAGTKTLIRPASPETIAAILQKRPATEREVTLYPTVSVGYESGRDIYGQRQSGTSTAVGVGVGVGSKQTSGTTEADRKTMEAELRDKGLPEGKAAKPVAGYLYFPVTSRDKAAYELEYAGQGTPIKVALPAPDA